MLFVIPAMMYAAMTSFGVVMSMLGAKKVVLTGLALERAMKARGHHPNEGIFTTRAGGIDGVRITSDSTDNLGQYLAALADEHPGLRRFVGTRVEFTEGEGQQLRLMLLPVMSSYDKMSELRKRLEELSETVSTILAGDATPEAREAMKAVRKEVSSAQEGIAEEELRITEQLEPVMLYLQRFPEARVYAA